MILDLDKLFLVIKGFILLTWRLEFVTRNLLLRAIGSEDVKGPQSATPLFLFTCESLAIIFSSEHVETKEITMRVLKIIKHTFRSTTY